MDFFCNHQTTTHILIIVALFFSYAYGSYTAQYPAIKRINNKARRAMQNCEYYKMQGRYKGKKVTWLLTEYEIEKLQSRASRNPEDL